MMLWTELPYRSTPVDDIEDTKDEQTVDDIEGTKDKQR